MKRIRKCMCLLLALLLIMGLAACSGNAEYDDISAPVDVEEHHTQTVPEETQVQIPVPDEVYVLVRTHGDDAVDEGLGTYYYYDKDGKMIRKEFYNRENGERSLYESIDYEYIPQADGTIAVNRIRVNAMNPGKQKIEEGALRYDAEWNLIYEEGSTRYETYEYDEEGRVIRTDSYTMRTASSEGGMLMSTYKYAYDADGNLVEETWGRGDSVSRTYHYEYDEAGHKIGSTYQILVAEGVYEEYQDAWFFEVDEYGRLIEEYNEEPSGITNQHWGYEYDQWGGMCRKTDLFVGVVYEYMPLSEHLAQQNG